MKIILVEDDDDLLLTLTFFLESEGHVVIACNKKRGALEQVINEHPDYALIDVKLPDGKGDELANEIKNHKDTNGVKIYLMSASEELSKLARDSKVEGYLKKPFSFQKVLEILN